MDLDELAILVDRLQAEGHGSDEVEIPCPTGGFYSPTDVEAEDGRVYIQ